MTFSASKLPNGLTILTYNMPNIQSVAINIVVKVGSRYETEQESGISHFLEHMAFKGTKSRTARDIAEQFDSIGGYFNAYTAKEQTVYYTKVLRNNCYQALEILADILQNSVFAKQDINKEYQVIMQEMAGVYDNPDELVYEKFYNVAYQNQPLGRSILGDEHILATFNSDSFKNYLAKHYNAGNLYLSVAGNIDHEVIVQYAGELFSALPNQQAKEFTKAEYTGGCQFITKNLEQTSLVLGFESVPYINLQEFYHAQILSLILGGGISSRLFQQIRENLGLAYSVGTSSSSYYDSGLFSIYVAANHENLKKLVENLVIEIKKITNKVTEAELERAKAQIKASIYMAEEKSSYKAEEIGKNFAIFGEYLPINTTIGCIMDTTIQDITNIASKIFASNPSLAIAGIRPQDIDYLNLCQNLIQ